MRIYDANGHRKFGEISIDPEDTFATLDRGIDATWTGHHDFAGAQSRFTGAFENWGEGPGFECGVSNPYGYGNTAFFVGYDRTDGTYIPMGFEASLYHFDLWSRDPSGTIFVLQAGSDPSTRTVAMGRGPAQFSGEFGAGGYDPAPRPGVEFGYSPFFSGAFMQAYHWGDETHIPFNIAASEIGFRIGADYDMALGIDSSGVVRVGDGTAAAQLSLNGGAGALRELDFRSADSQRWIIRASAEVESGSNAGSNFELLRRDDAGEDLGTAVRIDRSSGQWLFEDGSAASPELTFLDDADTGIYRAGTDALGFSTGGTDRMRIKSGGQVRFVPLSEDPPDAEAGDVYFNSSTGKLRVYDGNSWIDLH